MNHLIRPAELLIPSVTTQEANLKRTHALNAIALVAAALLVGSQARADDALPPDLDQAAKDYDRAQITGDRAGLERLIADDYTLVNSGADVQNKAQFIADSVAPGFRLEPFEVRHPINKVWRDGAVLSGDVILKGTSDGKAFTAHLRFADVWRRRNGRWQVVFTEVTPFPKNS